MRRKLALLAALASVLVLGTSAANAITDGELDGGGHPYVGLMRFVDSSDGLSYRCSGTLIAPQLFLTAGHCTYGSVNVRIYLGSDYRTTGLIGPYVTGTAYAHSSYNPNAFYRYDLGVVVLDTPVTMSQYGELPVQNQLDAFKPNSHTTFTAVGYGVQLINPAHVQKDLVRMYATPHLIQVNRGIVGDFSLLLSNNASTGGTCFGDSGGPNFIGDTNVIAGVTSFGLNGTCGGTGGVYRVDKADDLNWLAMFGITPPAP